MEKSLQLNTVDRQLSQCLKVWESGHAAHRLEETSSGLRQREAYKRHNRRLPLEEPLSYFLLGGYSLIASPPSLSHTVTQWLGQLLEGRSKNRQ